MALTLFSVFDVPVFWPILLVYFLALFFVTMKSRVKHMIKYKYLPFSTGKKVRAAAARVLWSVCVWPRACTRCALVCFARVCALLRRAPPRLLCLPPKPSPSLYLYQTQHMRAHTALRGRAAAATGRRRHARAGRRRPRRQGHVKAERS